MPKREPNMKNLVLMGFHHTPKKMHKYIICHAVTMTFMFWIYYILNGGIIPKFLIRAEPIKLHAGSKLVDHFPQTKGDGSKIKWGHATNSRISLMKAIQDPSVMMLEGDIQLKGQGTTYQQLLPVMVQGNNQEELTFADWLVVALESKKGIKLDFKTIEPIEICLQRLSSLKNQIKSAVHISANVLQGPNSEKSLYKPVDHQRFLRLVTTHFPQATLVAGWAEESSNPTRYTWDMVKQMYNAIASRTIEQPVAISVNAQFIKKSLAQIKWLSEMLDSQVTVYSVEDDEVNTNDLLFVRHKFSQELVYYDLHNKLSASFNESKDDIKQIAKEMMESNLVLRAEHWKIVKSDGSKIYLGSEALVIQKGLLLYNEDPYVYTNEPLKIKGKVEFFDIPVDKESQDDLGIEIFLHVANNVNVKSISGIKVYIGANGRISIGPYRIKDEVKDKEEIVLDGRTPCFVYEITEVSDKMIRVRVWRPLDCEDVSTSNHASSMMGEVELNLSKYSLSHKHIAILAENTYGFAAIDSFVINS